MTGTKWHGLMADVGLAVPVVGGLLHDGIGLNKLGLIALCRLGSLT